MKTALRVPAILCVCAVLVALVPVLLGTGSALTVICQMGIWVIFALAYNICLGQTGLLSFCHALFFGIGSYAAAHAINAVTDGSLPYIPVWAMPVIGFLAGGTLGAILAAFLRRRVGVAFVMITLGLSQLFIYLASTLDSVFGGEGGVSIDRAYGDTFGPQIEVYWLIAVWMLVSGLAMWMLTRTSFGKLARAVRDNEERARFLGQDVDRARFLAITLSAAFAGLAGALQAINIEQVSGHLLGLKTSAFVLFMVVIGGARNFWGPVVGAIIISLLDKVLPDYTAGWLLYLGLAFCGVILFAPEGIVGLLEKRYRALRSGERKIGMRDARSLLALGGFAILTVGLSMVIEMASAMSIGANFYESGELSLFGIGVDPVSFYPWLISAAFLAAGYLILTRFSRKEEA